MPPKLGYGIVGFGRVAEQHVKRADEAGMEFLAAMDGVPERRDAATSMGATAYSEVEALLKHDGVELVIVCTPPSTHCEITLQAVRAGKHVMVEKPFSMNLEEAHRMVEEARQHHVILTAHHNRRFDGDFLTVRKILESGILGNVYSIERRLTQFMEAWASWGTASFKPTWRVMKKYGGGLVYDWGSHFGDQVLQIASAKVETVYADLQSRVWSEEVDDHFRSMIRFTDGTSAVIEVSGNSRIELPAWHITGDKGTLTARGNQFEAKTAEGEFTFEHQASEWHRIHQNVVSAIRDAEELLVKPAEILRTMRLLDSMFDSSKISEVIRWQ